MHRFMRKADRVVDYEWARARVEAAKQRRAGLARDAGVPFERRTPDASTFTVLVPANTTTETVLIFATTTSTLPPATVVSGLFTNIITLATPIKIQFQFSFTSTTKVVTFGATFTKYTTVTPTNSVSACKNAGGHWW
jgi:hypothetical protein